ncbi:hypothetical protein QTN25_002221 [Entamoeba marina]
MNLQWILKEDKKEIMKEIGEEIVDGNENTDFCEQLKDFIDYCKDKISHSDSQQNQTDKTRESLNETNLAKEINCLRTEIQIRDDVIKNLEGHIEEQSCEKNKYTDELKKLKERIQQLTHLYEHSKKESSTKDNENKSKQIVKENEQLKQIINNAKDEKIIKLKQIITDLTEQNNQNVNKKEKIEKRDIVIKQRKQQKVEKPSKQQVPKQPESKQQKVKQPELKQQPLIEEQPSTKQPPIEKIKMMQPRKILVNAKATLYVSFVQSYVYLNQNVFDYSTFPVIIQKGTEVKHKVLEVEIPINYDKDVYYCEYVNRKKLFIKTGIEFSKIPVYFPIPVLRYVRQYTVIFHILPIRNKSCYIKLNVTVES